MNVVIAYKPQPLKIIFSTLNNYAFKLLLQYYVNKYIIIAVSN